MLVGKYFSRESFPTEYKRKSNRALWTNKELLDAIIESDKMDVNEASRVFDILVPTFKERNEKS